MDKLKALQESFEKEIWDMIPTLCNRGEIDRAKMYADVMVSLSSDRPELHARALQWLGMVLESNGDFDAAVLAYGRAISVEPTDAHLWHFLHNNLGYCLLQLGRNREAEWYCRQAIQIDPNLHNSHMNLGLSLKGQEKYGEAAQELAAAVLLYPQDDRARTHLEAMFEEHEILKLEMPDLTDLLALLRTTRIIEGPMGAPLEQAACPHPEVSPGVPGGRGAGAVVALLDDAEDLCTVLAKILNDAGCGTVIFESKEAFVRATRHLKVDAVVSDIYSPGIDGISLLEEMKARPHCRNIPVVIYSGHAEEQSAALRERGAFAIFQKPGNVESILEALWKALGK